MAHFQSPPNGVLGQYDVDSRLASGSIWRMRTALSGPGQGAEVALWGGDGLNVESNDPSVVANPGPGRTTQGLRVLPVRGLKVGTAMLEVRPPGGPVWVSLQVQVVSALHQVRDQALITLKGPSLALNASDSPVTYTLQHNITVAPGTSVAAIYKSIQQFGKLAHLVLNAHGHVSYDSTTHAITGSTINIGVGVGPNDDLFSKLRGVIEGGVIWICACAVGSDSAGNRERAKQAHAYFVSPVMYMQLKKGSSGKLPRGQIDMFARFMPTVCTPSGELLSFDGFVSKGQTLGFSVERG